MLSELYLTFYFPSKIKKKQPSNPQNSQKLRLIYVFRQNLIFTKSVFMRLESTLSTAWRQTFFICLYRIWGMYRIRKRLRKMMPFKCPKNSL